MRKFFRYAWYYNKLTICALGVITMILVVMMAK